MSDDFDFLDAISSDSEKGGGPRCPGCGQSVSEGAALCIGCGFNLKGGGSLTTSQSSENIDPVLKYSMIGGGVLLLIIFGFIAMAMLGGGDEPVRKPVATAPTPPPVKPKPTEPQPTEAELAAQAKAETEAAAAAELAAEKAAQDQARMKAEAEAAAKAKAEADAKARADAARLAALKAKMEAEKKFQESVDKAMASAQKYLLERYDAETDTFEGKYPQYIGESALATYALLKSGADPDNPRIIASLKAMLKYAYAKPGMDSRGTYNCGMVMLALDELRAASARRETSSESSATESTEARKVRLMIKGAMRKLAVGLNRNQQTGKSFSYGGGAAKKGHDLSIHQYALLGMWAAYRSGVKLVPGFWNQQVEYLMSIQHADGAFSYKSDRGPTGAMTTAGVGSLAICYLMLNEQRLKRQDWVQSPGEEPVVNDVEPLTDLEKAIAKGFKWLEGRGALGVGSPYYSYGLERTCALTQTKTLSGKDWYRVMATNMIAMQQKNGAWLGRFGETCSTAWNLLFLSKGTEKLFEDPVYEKHTEDDDGPVIGEGQKVDKIEEGDGNDEGVGEPPRKTLDGGNDKDFGGQPPVAPPGPGNPTAPGVNPGGVGGPPAVSLPKLRGLIPEEIPNRTP